MFTQLLQKPIDALGLMHYCINIKTLYHAPKANEICKAIVT